MENEEGSKVGRKSIPKELLEERRNWAVGLKLAGLSINSILKQVNLQADIKGWGDVTRRTIERDIADYFRKNRALTVQDYDHLDQMREALLAQMEAAIEKLSLFIANKPTGPDGKRRDWKPFEYVDAMEKLFKMQMSYAELQNWNLGRKNPFITFQQNNLNTVFDSANVELEIAQPEAIKALVAGIEEAIDKMKGAKGENTNVMDGEIIID
jgi:hypothetical protein